MEIVVGIIGLLGLCLILYVAYRYFKVRRENNKMNELRNERIKPLFQKLEGGIYVSPDEVYPYAANILSREDTFTLLQHFKQEGLFPAEFNTIVKAAESRLANWLEFPTELGKCPDEIEFVKQVTILFNNNEDEKIYYQVFRFKTHAPHWAANDGWIMGVTGPYFDDMPAYGCAMAFSRFVVEEKTSPEQEAQWMHDNIANRVG